MDSKFLVRVITFACALCLLGSPGVSRAEAPPLVLGIIPWEGQERLRYMFEPIVEHLAQSLGRKVIFVATSDYEDLEAKMAQAKVDIGLFTPGAYIRAKKNLPGLRYLVTPLTAVGPGVYDDHYRGVIIVRKDSGIRSIGELRGKRFAFTDRLSTSGYIYPLAMLLKMRIQPARYFREVFFLKKHDKITSALLAGAIDAGATWTGHLAKAQAESGDAFEVICQTDPIPNDAYVVGPRVPQSLAERIKGVFLGLDQQSPVMQAAVLRGLPYVAFSSRGDSFYDPVREADSVFRASANWPR